MDYMGILRQIKKNQKTPIFVGIFLVFFFSCFLEFCEMGCGGETGIRTLGGVTPTTVFETAPFDHSGTSPRFGSGWWGHSGRRQGAQGGVGSCLQDFLRP